MTEDRFRYPLEQREGVIQITASRFNVLDLNELVLTTS